MQCVNVFASQYITIVHLSQCWRECHCHGSLALPIPVEMQQATAGGCVSGVSGLPLVVPLQQKNCWLSAGFQGALSAIQFPRFQDSHSCLCSICQIFSCHLQYWGSNIVQPMFSPLEALQKSAPWQPLAPVFFPHAHSTCLFLHLYTTESSKKWVCIN